jgi:hypothetical protein
LVILARWAISSIEVAWKPLREKEASSDLDELLAALLARHAGAPALLAHAAPALC